MAPKRSQEPSTPVTPSLGGLRPRRGSLSSLASRSSVSKQSFVQALDKIHTSASQSEALTTFSDFVPPPGSSSGDGKGLGTDIVQAGLSGLYTRIKASVGAIQNAGRFSSVTSTDSGNDGVANTYKSKTASKPLILPNSPPLQSQLALEPSSGLRSPLAATFGLTTDGDRASATPATHLPNTSGSARNSAATTKIQLAPFTHAGPSMAAPATADYVSVCAVRDGSLVSTSASEIDLPQEGNTSGPRRTQPKHRAQPLGDELAQHHHQVGSVDKDHSSSMTVSKHGEVSTGSNNAMTFLALEAPQESMGLDSGAHVDHSDNYNKVDSPGRDTTTTPLAKSHPVQQAQADMQSPSSRTLTTVTTPRRLSLLLNNESDQSGCDPARTPSVDQGDQGSMSEPHSTNAAAPFNLNPQSRKGKGSKLYTSNENPSPMAPSQVRRSLLSKDFWMKDENAKDCFYCGKPFSTFRRKHHCRLCGQIFDSACTSLVPGRTFGQSANIRICKICKKTIHGGSDDSSDFSEDGDTYKGPPSRPLSSIGLNDYLDGEHFVETSRSADNALRDITKSATPTRSSPVCRRTVESERHSSVLEFDNLSALARPSSSRSLKSMKLRPHSSSYKRHASRHQYLRSLKSMHDDRVPFQRTVADGRESSTLPVFHQDSIIDPDLAPFLSDDASGGDEQASILATMNDYEHGASTKHGRNGLNVVFAGAQKLRHKPVDKIREDGDAPRRIVDTLSLPSPRVGQVSRMSRRRNLSIGSFSHVRPGTRVSKSASTLQAGSTFDDLADQYHPGISKDSPPSASGDTSQVITSSAMRGADAPAVELNSASLDHVRRLLKQLLEDGRVPPVSNWETALVPILLQCTDDVDPDVHHGDDIDIRSYIKIKKIPGGRAGDTAYVSGVVFSKNVALKSMPRHILHPRVVIITFPVEYSRHGHHFMSLEPVIAQEQEYLRNLVNRILALDPQVLLVQGNVAGHALEYLEEAKVAVVYNVKTAVLNAVIRCTQTRRISSINQLTIEHYRPSKCASFDVKTYVHQGVKKSFIFLSGCHKELGCTIVLRGAETKTLRTVKRITEFMCYVVYNLKLETCLMRDEFVLIPSRPHGGSVSPTKGLTEKQTKAAQPPLAAMKDSPSLANNQFQDRSYKVNGSVSSSLANIVESSTSADGAVSFEGPNESSKDHVQVSQEMPVRTFYSNVVEEHRTKILSASPFVKFMQPYLLMKVIEEERLVMHFKRLLELDAQEEIAPETTASSYAFCLVSPDMIDGRIESASKQIREILHALHQAEYDDAMHNYRTRKKQWEYLISNNQSLFDPFAHQSVVVLFGIVCTPTSVPCNGPDIHVLEYYSNEHSASDPQACDSTLGQYVEHVCHSAYSTCNANGCDKKMLDHHRQYVHGDGQISIFVQTYPSKIRGLQNTILMWSCCTICGKETQIVPMSDNTWKYSFGKYLELSFWNMELHARAGICPHDIHRNHIRFFGFMDLAVRVQYDQINLFEISIPRMTITWKIDSDLRLKNDQFKKIEERLNRFVSSVKARLQSIQLSSVLPEKSQACNAELDNLKKRANDEHKFLIEKLRAKYTTSGYYECIPLNRAIRAMQEKVAEWDTTFMDFERNFFPSERDIRRLAMNQFKKLFIDREEAISSFSSEEGVNTSETETGEVKGGEHKPEGPCSGMPSGPNPDTVQATEALARTLIERQGDHPTIPVLNNQKEASQHSEAAKHDLMPRRISSQAVETEAVQPLDLAVSTRSQDVQLESVEAVSPLSELGSIASPHTAETMEVSSDSDVRSRNPTLSEKIEQMRATAVRTESFAVVLESRIPRPFDPTSRSVGARMVPPLSRTQSQPAALAKSLSSSGELSNAPTADPSLDHTVSLVCAQKPKSSETTAVYLQKLPDKIDLLKSAKLAGHSMIPRSVQTYHPDTRVSLLAKHFEQLSREFEKERLRERRLWAERNRQSRAYPVALSKPVVEVYRDAHEAEQGTTTPQERTDNNRALSPDAHVPAEPVRRPESGTVPDTLAQHSGVTSPLDADIMSRRDETQPSTEPTSEGEEERIDTERASVDETLVSEIEEKDRSGAPEPQLDPNLELPKHQKISFIKMLSSFWSERSSSGWTPLEYPLIPTDHVFVDSDIIVREDEPSSVIAFVLASQSYQTELQKIQRLGQANRGRLDKHQSQAGERTDDAPLHFLTRGVDRHVDVAFQEGTAKMSCKAWYAGSFDALRRECGVSHRIVEALSRCLKWDSKGGKTKSLFLKTLDERFILKSLSATEQAAFKDLAFDYFKYMAELLFEGVNSAIAKIVGFYDVKITNPSTGVEFERSLLVMENLFYDCNPAQKFDLKGSMRNRKVRSTGEQDEVLLDENMVEFIYEKPIFVRQHSKSLFTKCIKNDTAFLAARNVMDYSLMLGFDEEKKELVVGLIDYIRTYTWDKKLESWIKDRGKNKPTITSPIDYRNRFRGSMSNYVLVAPNCWYQFRRGNAVAVRTAEASSVKVEEPPSAEALHGSAERADSREKEAVEEEENIETEQNEIRS